MIDESGFGGEMSTQATTNRKNMLENRRHFVEN